MRFSTLLLIAALFSFRPNFPPTDASFSCMINGTSFSSDETDGMANAAFKTAKDIITFSLVSMDPKYKGKIRKRQVQRKVFTGKYVGCL